MVALAATGCSVVEAPSSHLGSPVPQDTPPAEADDDPAAGLPYACESAPFDIRLFRMPADAESSNDAAVDGLRKTLAADPTLPKSGWWQTARGVADAEFAARTADGRGFWYVQVKMGGGVWDINNWGGCEPRLRVAGFSTVRWQLDPEPPQPGPDTRVIRALVSELCESDPLVGRLEPPIVRRTADLVLVAFVARPGAGGHGELPVGGTAGGRLTAARHGRSVVSAALYDHCAGLAEAVVQVDLEEPLGDRVLLDGAYWPGRDARQPVGP